MPAFIWPSSKLINRVNKIGFLETTDKCAQGPALNPQYIANQTLQAFQH